ncbi:MULTISPECIES: thiamine phosphate synthase [Dermabacter]|uniref:thiamine phosphate synthase n=1 Tax=Dermabacter TaxID=36739 RepID=UPI000773F0E1|nr:MULTISPECIES: thiamine phosphate synthase [Dermabacter]MCT1955944.1 thiamine phosphate synthase [Dermabacter hominis]MDU1463504.1 thiamine phosphate synthase [Dermabacter sp.]MDU4692101.1 thiamine phosphate synthase [Dermabacter sp.]
MNTSASRERAAKADWALYFVTDSAMAGGADKVPAQVAEAIEGGAHVIQVRDKDLDDDAFVELARQVRDVAREVGEQHGREITVIVNDRVEAARELGLDVHVGQGDMPASQVRELLGAEAIIGVSVSNAEQLEGVIAEGSADVVGIGPIWNTATKTDTDPAVGLEQLASLTTRAHEAGIVAVAIGGISIRNASEVAATGCDGICVVSAIAGSEDPATSATFLRREFVMNQPL